MKKLMFILLLTGMITCSHTEPTTIVIPTHRLSVWRTGDGRFGRSWTANAPAPKPDTLTIRGIVYYKDSGYQIYYSSQGKYILLHNDSTKY